MPVTAWCYDEEAFYVKWNKQRDAQTHLGYWWYKIPLPDDAEFVWVPETQADPVAESAGESEDDEAPLILDFSDPKPGSSEPDTAMDDVFQTNPQNRAGVVSGESTASSGSVRAPKLKRRKTNNKLNNWNLPCRRHTLLLLGAEQQ